MRHQKKDGLLVEPPPTRNPESGGSLIPLDARKSNTGHPESAILANDDDNRSTASIPNDRPEEV